MRSGGRVVTWASSDNVHVAEAEIQQLRRQHLRAEDVWIEDRERTEIRSSEDTPGLDNG
jgi:hypothetical protein